MAFANLFTKLSAVEAEVKSPVQPAFTHRNEAEKGKRGKARKRKTQGEHTDPYKKKQCYQAQTARTYNATSDDSKATHYHMHNTDSKHASFGFTKEVIHRHSDKARHNNMCHNGQNYQTENNHNVNKQQEQKKKMEGQKNQHHQKNKGRPAYKGGGPPLRKGGRDRKNKNDKQDFQVKRSRFMTQEFKDQNVLLVDGRLLCRHFLWGRCIKGDDCQLEHVQVYNDLIKELCKFYVQGLCTKGESCPYMHKSFPCKFFHRRGKCSQGADCRFSHEPLNDVTSQLLDEAIKRENELYELANKTEQKSPGHPANTDESEIIEASRTPDIILQPLRPNFYKSADTNAEKEALFCQTEELTDIAAEAVPPRASDAAQPHSPPSANINQEEPVCYSVEAVLGPQLSKPFTSFFTTSRSQGYAPLSSFDLMSDSANQSQAPYSVDAVLRSCKSVETSTFGHTTTPSTTQTLFYTPKTYFEEISDPLLNTKVSSKTCPTHTLASKKQGGKMPESPKLAERAAHEASSKPFCPSSGFTEYKGRAAVPAEPVTSSVKSSDSANSHHFVAKQPTEVHLGSKKTQPGLSLGTKQDYSTETTTEGSSKIAHCGGLAVGSKKKTAFHSLFASPITDTQPIDDSVTSSSCSQASVQSSCPAPESADSRSNHLKTALEPDKSSARSFLSLFAAPLSAAPLPCTESQPDFSRTSSSSQQSLQSGDNTSHSPDSKLRASNLETPLPCQVREISHVPRFPNFSANESEKDSLPERISQPMKQLVNPVCSLVSDHLSETSTTPTTCGDSQSTNHAHQQLPDTSSHKGSTGAATSNSVLKTLFLCLRPYQEDDEQQDRIQISVPSESEKKHESSTGFVSEHQQKSLKKKGRQKKKFETQDSHKQSHTYDSTSPLQPRPLKSPLRQQVGRPSAVQE